MRLRTVMRPRALTVVVVAMVASGCVVGPDYVRPPVVTPDAYKEMQGWTVARPADSAIRGPWWEIFTDARLSELEVQVDVANQNLAVADAQFRQARALVRQARAGYFPQVTIGASVTHSRQPVLSNGLPGTGKAITQFVLPIDATWEPDLWGRIRRTVESNQAAAQASAADLETSRLSLHAELATDYLQLRTLDAQKQLLDDAVAYYERSLQLTRNRYAAGVASRADVVQAETQLETTRAQALDVEVQRAQLEHAIAVLTGRPPASLSLAAAPLTAGPPPIPVGLPSELLERRPDVAAAERRMAAANAQIGVARAAFFPTVTLSATAGFESTGLSSWLTWPSRFWAVGPSITQTVFDGGLRRAQSDQARAAYEGAVATYHQTVLTAFQDVEDDLAALHILEQEVVAQDAAVRAARETVTVVTNQYRAGTLSYLDVVVAQTTLLTNERTAVDILGRRLTASALLIKALGGGWTTSQLPSAKEATKP